MWYRLWNREYGSTVSFRTGSCFFRVQKLCSLCTLRTRQYKGGVHSKPTKYNRDWFLRGQKREICVATSPNALSNNLTVARGTQGQGNMHSRHASAFAAGSVHTLPSIIYLCCLYIV